MSSMERGSLYIRKCVYVVSSRMLNNPAFLGQWFLAMTNGSWSTRFGVVIPSAGNWSSWSLCYPVFTYTVCELTQLTGGQYSVNHNRVCNTTLYGLWAKHCWWVFTIPIWTTVAITSCQSGKPIAPRRNNYIYTSIWKKWRKTQTVKLHFPLQPWDNLRSTYVSVLIRTSVISSATLASH